MRCQEVKPLLYTYLDGSLAGQVERALFGHLSQCNNCQQDLDYARQTHALLEKYCTPVEPPFDFVNQVMSAIDGTLADKPVAKIQEHPKVVHREVKKSQKGSQSFSWGFRRVAQVASFVLLSATVWFTTQFNGGLQLARTPNPGNNPGTGYEVAKEPKEQKPANGFEVAIKEEPNGVQEFIQPQDELPELIEPEENSPGKSSDIKTAPEGNKDLVGESNGSVRETKQEPSPKNPIADSPGTVPGNQLAPDPVPTPRILEPTGPIKAAGAEGGIALSSVSLQRVALGETKGSNGIFSGSQVKYLAGTNGNPLEIWIVGSGGEKPELLGKTAKTVDGKAIWSTDGRKLAYIHKENNHSALYIDDLAGVASKLGLPAVETGEIKFPVWSKKGEIAYVLAGASGNKIVVSKGQESHVIGTTDADCGPAWSPDGVSIAYGKEGQLHIASSDGTQGKSILELGGRPQSITWSPDGSYLAVSVKAANNQQGLWMGRNDGSDWKRIVEVGGGRELSWSPDARKLAFTDGQGMAYLLTFTVEGKRDKLYPITPEAGNNGVTSLAWSSDSKSLLVEWAPAGEVQSIWRAIMP